MSGVSFDIGAGETLGLVGESGSGKTTTGRALLQLHKPTSGSVRFDGQELTTLDAKAMRAVRRDMQIVFQDPYASLNPKQPVNDIISEPLRVHGKWEKQVGPGAGRRAAARGRPAPRARQPLPARVLRRSAPARRHRQGAGARAALLGARRAGVGARRQRPGRRRQPADEAAGRARLGVPVRRPRPVGGAPHLRSGGRDVPRQDRRGRAARRRSTTRPTHPYTQALVSAVPVPNPKLERARRRIVLQGDIPSPVDPPSGCRFRTRCWKAQEICAVEEPALIDRGAGHPVACHFAADDRAEHVAAVAGS